MSMMSSMVDSMQQHSVSQHKGEQGFSLIEGMLAAAILSVGLLAMSGMQTISLVKNVDANESTLTTAMAADILERSPQNSVFYPSLSVKGSPQAIRVIRPLAANRTLIEAWSFRAAGAPEVLFQRAMTYNRLVFSPMSVVAHDDVHLFESMQRGLAANGNDWVSLHRDFDAAEIGQGTVTTNGTNELLMRNQFRAWARYMASASVSASATST